MKKIHLYQKEQEEKTSLESQTLKKGPERLREKKKFLGILKENSPDSGAMVREEVPGTVGSGHFFFDLENPARFSKIVKSNALERR